MLSSSTKRVRTTFVLLSFIVLSSDVAVRVLVRSGLSFVANSVSGIYYFIVSIILINATRKLSANIIGKNIVLIWFGLFAVIFLHNIYYLFEVRRFFSITMIILPNLGIPVEVLCSAIGTYVVYLLSKQLFAYILTVINIAVIIFVLSGLLLSIANNTENYMRIVFQYSFILFINLFTIGIFYNID